MAKKIDPLNRKQYGAVSAMLTVNDVKGAASFYQKAFGFTKRGIMNGPDGKPMHAELTLRGTTVMLGPEWGSSKSPQALGGSAVRLYVYVDDADKVAARAVKLGAAITMPVMDAFWGDRCGGLRDPYGHEWMVATHIAEPTPQEMKKKMKEQMSGQTASAAGSSS
jgi:PhnB protein